MSFLKGVKGTIEFPIVVQIPSVNTKGKEIVIEVTPIVQYKRFKRSESRKLQTKVAQISKEAAKSFEDGDIEALFGERLSFFDDLVRDSVVGWRKMPGPDGEVPFSEEALEEAIEDNYYFGAFLGGLRRALGWGDASGKQAEEAPEAKN